MRILSYTFETTIDFSSMVRDHDFVLRCMPRTRPGKQTVLAAHVMIAPNGPLAKQFDGFGNVLRIGRARAAHSTFSFASSGMVVVNGDVGADVVDPQDARVHPMFLQPSALATADASLAAFAQSVRYSVESDARLAGEAGGGAWDIASALSQTIHARLKYETGVTGVDTTAAEAFAFGRGVCQDFSQVLVAACRSLGIPARYVNGLMVGEGATHAWVEVHDGKRWRGLDPTNDRVVDDGYITFCHGRDFRDIPIERGVFKGNACQEQSVIIRVTDQASRTI